MELSKLKAQIKTKSPEAFYIFCGDEWKVQEIYINELSKLYDRRLYIDSIRDVYTQLKHTSFIKQRTLYIVRDDHDIMTNEKLQAQLSSLLADNTLILLVSSVDKRTKFYKTYSESFVEFNALERAVLKRYVQKEIKLSDKNTELLIELCESNYGRILLEIDKIRRYADGTNV